MRQLMSNGQAVYGTSKNPTSISPSVLQLDLERPPEHFFKNGYVSQLASESKLIVFLCAAKTKLLDCENNPEHSYRVNVVNTIEYAKQFLQLNASIIFLSSSAVFCKSTPIPNESTARNPRTKYGAQKKSAEDLLLNLQTDNPGTFTAIVRLTKVLHRSHDLASGWIRSLRSGNKIQAFSDRTLTPISLGYTVSNLLEIANGGVSGVFHLSGNSEISYYEFAKNLANHLKADKRLVEPVFSGFNRGVLGEVYGGKLAPTSLNEMLSIGSEPLDRMIDSFFGVSK